MTNFESTPAILDTIADVSFPSRFGNYSANDVDNYLEALAPQVTQLRHSNEQLEGQLRQAAERIRQLEARAGGSAAPAPSAQPVAPSRSAMDIAEETRGIIATAHEFATKLTHKVEYCANSSV